MKHSVDLIFLLDVSFIVPRLQPLHFAPAASASETDRPFHWFGPSGSLHHLNVLTQQKSIEKTKCYLES